MLIATAAQMRECDRFTIEALGMPGYALMENAGRGATLALLDHLSGGTDHGDHHHKGSTDHFEETFGVFAGGGNNGGDGFVIARELLARGLEVDTIVMGRRAQYTGDALIALTLLERTLEANLTPGTGELCYFGDALDQGDDLDDLLDTLPAYSVIVDALFGTGLSRPVEGAYAGVIEAINALADATILAVDIASGVDADSGAILGVAVDADLTATFGLPKRGQVLYPGRSVTGSLVIVDIGIPAGVFPHVGVEAQALDAALCRALLPPRPRTAHKGVFGHALVIGGARGKGGALTLAAAATLRVGAGLVTAGGEIDVLAQLTTRHPEIMTEVCCCSGSFQDEIAALLKGKNVVAIGPGLGQSPDAVATLEALLGAADVPLVLDADALNIIAAFTNPVEALAAHSRKRPIVLTPHPKEFERLSEVPTDKAADDPVTHALTFAAATGCVVALKGAATVVASPEGMLAINTSGNPGMASAGMGDVLTGMIAGMIAQGLPPFEATCAAVYLHGSAGDRAAKATGSRALIATDVIDAVGGAMTHAEGA